MSGNPIPASGVESPLVGPIRESLRRAEADMQELESKMTHDAAPLGLDQINDDSLRPRKSC